MSLVLLILVLLAVSESMEDGSIIGCDLSVTGDSMVAMAAAAIMAGGGSSFMILHPQTQTQRETKYTGKQNQ